MTTKQFNQALKQMSLKKANLILAQFYNDNIDYIFSGELDDDLANLPVAIRAVIEKMKVGGR